MRLGDVVRDVDGQVGVVQRVVNGPSPTDHGVVEVLITKPVYPYVTEPVYQYLSVQGDSFSHLEHYPHWGCRRYLKTLHPAVPSKLQKVHEVMDS